MPRKKPDKTIRIKYYGLVPISKRGYLRIVVATPVVAGIILLVAWAAGVLPPLSTLWGEHWPEAAKTPWPWLYNYMYWFIIIGVLLEAVDVWTMLRKFKQKEEEQRAKMPQPQEEAKT